MVSQTVRTTFALPADLLVAYPRSADKYLGPLVSRLRGVNQPVIRTRNAFSIPRLTPLPCV